MRHLDTDRLAALADEAPTADEASHLATCLACRRERDAFVALLALAQREWAASLLADAPAAPSATPTDPLTTWAPIASALRAEGLVRSSADVVPLRPRASVRRAVPAVAWRAAASIALLVGGAAVGRVTAPAVAAPPADAAQVASAPAPSTPAAVPVMAAPAQLASNGLSDTLPVYGEPPVGTMRAFASVADAMQALQQAQRDYQGAANYLAEHDNASAAPQQLRARLAALDEVMPKVREALYEAPQDPVLTQYYLTTADVRESTLRQLGRALPVGVRLNGY